MKLALATRLVTWLLPICLISITSEMRTIPIADLGRTLLKLPVEAWPYGRVVGLQACGLGVPGDELQQAKHLLDVKAVLNSLRLLIYEWPP